MNVRARLPNSSTRTRVLYFIDHVSSTGGAERFAVGLATHLPAERFEVWMCATRSTDPLAREQLEAAGVQFVALGRRAKWDAHRLSALASLLRRAQIDVLHTHKFGSNAWGTLIGRSVRTPVIVAHEHSWEYEGNPVRAWVDGHIVGRLADRVIAVSSADAERMARIEGIDPAKVVVVPNGYIPSAAVTDTDVRREVGLGADDAVIAIAAVLRPEKRIDLLLQAHAEVLTQVPNAHLVIAGDGDCRGDLEARADALGIAAQVHFLGARSDVDSVLRAADCGVLASDREGSPLLIFECMANETALVATRVGGVPDVIEDGRTGVLVPRRDPGAMAEALIGLLTDPARRAAIAGAARASLAGYTIEAIAERFADLYESLLAAA